MTKVMSEKALVQTVAKLALDRTVAAVVDNLDSMDGGLSGDDSGLDTVWEEICVQVRHEQSFSWDLYDELVRDLISQELPKLQDHEKAAIWLQTDEGISWLYDDEEDRDEDVSVDEELLNYIAGTLYSRAADFERDSITEYMERMYESDD